MFRKNEIEHLTHDIEQIFKFNFLENFFFLFFFRWKKCILYFFTYFHVQNYLLDIEIYNWKLIVFENFLKLISFENEALKEKTIISIYFCM